MNRLGQQLLQTSLPAALGYAAGRHHAATVQKTNGYITPSQGKNFADSPHSQPERVHPNQQPPIRNRCSGSTSAIQPDYPARDFLPFYVTRVNYSHILKKISGNNLNAHNPNSATKNN